MRDYVKPMVLANEELAEGVYAGGSGASTEDSSVSYSIDNSKTNAWTGNAIYYITFTNNSDESLSGITVTVTCVGTVNSIGGNVTGTVNGDGTATITFTNHGNGIAPKTSYPVDYVLVTGDGSFSIV